VSRVLKEKYYTTSSMSKITERLGSFHNLCPGDMLSWSRSHLRRCVGFSGEGQRRLNTIGSAVSRGGVCAAS